MNYEVIIFNRGKSWGNFFLTDNHKLYIDFSCVQHEVAMRRIGIESSDLLLSGFFHDDIVSFRSTDHYRLIPIIESLVKKWTYETNKSNRKTKHD